MATRKDYQALKNLLLHRKAKLMEKTPLQIRGLAEAAPHLGPEELHLSSTYMTLRQEFHERAIIDQILKMIEKLGV